MFDRYGAEQTVAKLVHAPSGNPRADFGQLDQVFDGIASGDERWLALVPRLDRGVGAYAAAAESVPIVVARALPKNPAGVLRLITGDPSWRAVCSYPEIEPTRQETRAYFRSALPAVLAVREPALQAAKRACMSELRKAERRQ
jgi:hypothetical protein